jgi:PKD repeat protein
MKASTLQYGETRRYSGQYGSSTGNDNLSFSRASSVANPENFTATGTTLSSILLQWQKNASNNNVMIAFNTYGIQLPVDGTVYSAGDILPGGGIVIYSGPNTSYTQTGLQQGSFYIYRAWSYDNSHVYSSGVEAYSYTCSPPVSRFTASNLTPDISQVIQLTDNTSFLPTSWSWEISPATVIYTAGTNTSQNPQVQFTAMGLYTVTLTVSNVWGSDTEIKTEYITVGPTTYCTPTYIDGTYGGDYISLVQLGSINNATGPSPDPYYTFNSNMSTDLAPGDDYAITLSPGTYVDGNWISVWIDYNHDLLFGDDEKLGTINIDPYPATGTISFIVPLDAVSGITRMRVREVWLGEYVDACTTYGYGETEDYNVNILAPYCIPTYVYGTLNGDYISNVQLGSIDNTTGPSVESPYYTYYNTLSTDLMPGNDYSITLSPGAFSQENWFYVWIDFNHNQEFESLEMVGSLYLAQAPATGTIVFSVPTSAVVGKTRMRVREINGLNFENPCFEYGGGETEDYNINILNPYCIPAYNIGSTDGDYISLVQLGSINNASGASDNPYYTYYSYLSTNLFLGDNYSITLSPGAVANGNNIAVWIDYNHNLLFEPTEKLGTINVEASPATGTIDFTVPFDAIQGTTRMRVREVQGEYSFDDCSTYDFGETEDYNVNILPQYCIPGYSIGTGGGDYISLVQLGSINNATGPSESPFYSYYSNMSTDVVSGNVYSITLSPGAYTNNNYG